MENSITRKIEELRPWRYNHQNGDCHINADNIESALVHDKYGKKLLIHILKKSLKHLDSAENLRVLDLGCLEGHYSDILCSFGFGEVVSIDLSEKHIARANFLLKEFKKYKNSTIIQGNVLDTTLLDSLGKFDIIFFHGLLYHLSSPLLIFDIIEKLIRNNSKFFLLLGHQYHMDYNLMVAPYSLAEIKIRSFASDKNGLVLSPKDESVFNISSARLNVKALYELLKAYNYSEIISYDTPKLLKRTNYASQFVLSKRKCDALLKDLNEDLSITKCRFYNWDGNSVDHYKFNRSPKALFLKTIFFLLKIFTRIFSKFQ